MPIAPEWSVDGCSPRWVIAGEGPLATWRRNGAATRLGDCSPALLPGARCRTSCPGLTNRQISRVRHASGVDLVRFGRGIRALRMRRHWRQVDLAAAADVSQTIVTRIERGAADTVPLRKVERVGAALGARVDVRLNYNGEALDRHLDAAHSQLVEFVAGYLRGRGWEVVLEATFSIFGERGSVDVLGWHAATRSVLIVEVKSIVPDVQAMLAAIDRKGRLAPAIARDRGWQAGAISTLLVIGGSRTSRRRVEAHAITFEQTFPDRAVAARRWLAAPRRSEPLRALWFVSSSQQVTGRHRVRRAEGRPTRGTRR
jgi:transcriptional regulator with XRE-family HTH domain